jgi:hypothetical protein
MAALRSVLTTAAVSMGLFASRAAPLVAQPSPLNPPHLTGGVAFNFGPPGGVPADHFGMVELADSRFGVLSFFSTGAPAPALIANADVGLSLTPVIFGRAGGALEYSVELVGSAGLVPVEITVTGFASAAAGAGASFAVQSRWDLLDGGLVLVGDEIRSGQMTGGFNDDFTRIVSLTLAANHVYTVFLLADAGAAATDVGSHAIATAAIDPIFSLGPGVDPLSYSFVFSEGIGNTRPAAVVPEPATLALLGAGLLALGLMRRGSSRGSRAGG